jgi:ATP-dependent Clp protease adaptor protein ClpS
MSETETQQRNLVTTTIIEPRKYKVIILNDDHTPMEFVIDVLMNIFNHNQESSEQLTMVIHHEGSAIAGIYPYEIAEQKSVETTHLARQAGFPLNVKIESE